MPADSIPPRSSVVIQPEQWTIPVSFTDQNQPVTLRQYADHNAGALPLSKLTPGQRVELVARRLEMQPGYKMAILGEGVYDGPAAAKEVRAGSEVGQTLASIEIRVIQHLLTAADQIRE